MSIRTSVSPRILILSLSASEPSVGRQCLPILDTALYKAGATVTLCDIRTLPPVWVDKRNLEAFPAAYSDLYKEVESSDGVVLIVPIHCYTASGAAKSVTEIIGDALSRKPVAIVTAAGSHRSHLAARDLVASMMFEQETICYPGTVQATEDLLVDCSPNKELHDRLTTLGTEFVLFVAALMPFIAEFAEINDGD